MSAWGPKQTFALHQLMSALLRKQTLDDDAGMSAMGQ